MLLNRTSIASAVFLVILFSPFPGKGAYAGPSMAVPETRFNAGRVREGEVIEHRFAVRNQGDRTLVIQHVKPDCGCTTAEYDASIEPGTTGHIALRLDTRGFRGEMAKHTRVITNDPQQKMAVLTMAADVWTPIALSKSYVVFKGAAGKTYSEAIDIHAEMERILELEPQPFELEDKVSYSIEEVDEGRHYRITFTSRPGSGDRFHGRFRLKTNYPEKPEIEIRVRAWFKDEG